MKPTNGRHGHEMDQFQANLRALQTAAPTDPEGQPAEALPGRSGTPVPYPDNPIWAAALRGWAPQPPTAPPAQAPERVASCHGLQAGTAIEARGPHGVVAFEGTVEDTAPAHRLFWAGSRQGHRKIIDLDEYEVYIL